MWQSGGDEGRRGGGQAEDEGGAFAGDARAFDGDRAAHGLGEDTAEIEAEAGADDAGGEVAREANEAVEQQRRLVGWDALAVIADADLDQFARGRGGAAAEGGGGGGQRTAGDLDGRAGG